MNWLLKIGRGFVLRRAVAIVAAKIKEDPALLSALRSYVNGDSFLQIVHRYADAEDLAQQQAILAAIDQVKDSLDKVPFRDLLALYLKDLKIPDFDGDPSNDLAVNEAIDRVVAEALK